MAKKLISIIISISVLMSVFSTLSFAEQDVQLSEKTLKALSVMQALDFVNDDYDEESVIQSEPMTRAAFAVFVESFANPNGLMSGNMYYHDVPKSHYAYEAITSLTDKGIFSVSSDKYFNPDRLITIDEASKVLLYVIGYSSLVEAMGGYPDGVRKMSSDVDLLEGVSKDNEVSFADTLVMSYNALTTEILEMQGISSGYGIQYAGNGETYLSAYFDIYVNTGIVKGYDETSVYGDAVGEGAAVIGNEYLEKSEIDISDYLGYKVDYFYKYNEKLDEKTLLWIGKTKKNEELVLNKIENQFVFDPTTYTIIYYNDGGRSKKESVKNNVSVVYNGSYLKENVLQKLAEDIYSVKLIDNNGDGFSVAIVEDYKNYIHVSGDSKTELLYLKNCDNTANGVYNYEQIDTKQYDRVDIFAQDGSKIGIADIKLGTVLTILDTPDKSRLTVYCSEDTVSGNISSISTDDGYTVITIDDTEYMTYIKGLNLNLQMGSTIKLKLDKYGYICALDLQRGDVNFGYFLRSWYDEYAIEEKVIVKMLDMNGNIVRIDMAQKASIDGIRYTSVETLNGAMPVNPQLMAYKLNSKGQITKIDTPISYSNSGTRTADNMLVELSDYKSVAYENVNRKLGPLCRVNENTVVFGIPSDIDGADDKEFSSGTGNSFTHDNSYTAAIYNYGASNNEFADVVVCKDFAIGVPYWMSTKVVVESINETLNIDDEVVALIEGYHGNEKCELYLSVDATKKAMDPTNGLKRGDVIAMAGYNGEEFADYTLEYRYGGTRPVNKSFTVGGSRATTAYVHDIIGETIQCGFDSGETLEEVFRIGNATVFIYDSQDNELTIGGIGDLKPYTAVGDSCSTIFLYIVNSEVRNFVVYR